MLCTNSQVILNSANGRRVLGYRPPRYPPHFDPSAKAIIITWDILQMNYRCINTTYCYLIKQYESEQEFWQVFNEKYLNMTPLDKLAWMDAGSTT